jgi:hypothetical protein
MAARQNAYNGRSEFGSLFERGFELCLTLLPLSSNLIVPTTFAISSFRLLGEYLLLQFCPEICVWLFYRFRHFQGTVCLQRFVRSTVFDNCIMVCYSVQSVVDTLFLGSDESDRTAKRKIDSPPSDRGAGLDHDFNAISGQN